MFGDDIADRSGEQRQAVPKFGQVGGGSGGAFAGKPSSTTIPPGQLQFGAFGAKKQAHGSTSSFAPAPAGTQASPTQPFRGRGASGTAHAPMSPTDQRGDFADESGQSGQSAHTSGRRLFGAGGDSAGSAGELDGWQSLGAADGTGPSHAQAGSEASGAIGGTGQGAGFDTPTTGTGQPGPQQQHDAGISGAMGVFGGMFGGAPAAGGQQPGAGGSGAGEQDAGGATGWWPFGRRAGVVPALGYDPDVPGQGEASLLAELEIDFEEVGRKTMTVLMPWNRISETERTVVAGGDVIGPLLVGLALGFVLLFEAKLHFGYIYGFGVMGCLGLYVVLNLMSRTEEGVGMGQVLSIYGYSLIPIVVLALLCLVIPSHSLGGALLGAACVGWSTWAATRLLEVVMRAREQRYLLAYPSFLLYATFALITLF